MQIIVGDNFDGWIRLTCSEYGTVYFADFSRMKKAFTQQAHIKKCFLIFFSKTLLHNN